MVADVVEGVEGVAVRVVKVDREELDQAIIRPVVTRAASEAVAPRFSWCAWM